MNYIKKLQAENQELRAQIETARQLTVNALIYYRGEKFAGIENDFAHVSTDVVHKIEEIKNSL